MANYRVSAIDIDTNETVLIPAPEGAELTSTQANDSTGTTFGTISGQILHNTIRAKTEQINAQFSAGSTIDVTTLGLVKNQRLYLYSSTGAPAQLKVRFNDTFTKTVSVNGATGTTVGNVVTIEGVQSAIVYQEFAEASTVGGVTRIVCDPGSASTRPVVTGVNTDQGLATWQANAKAGDIAEDIRTGTIYESRGGGGALRLTPNWIDRMDYTVTAATSIADGLVADSMISGMNGAAFLRGNRGRKAIIKQATATTLGALFTAINTQLTAGTLTNITEIGYRRSASANWMYYDGTDPVVDGATSVPVGWYLISFLNNTEFYIEPLAAQVTQVVYYTGTTPDIPPSTTLPALALNTTAGKITHWWNTTTVAWVASSPNLPAHSTTEHLTGEAWTNGKPIYRKTWTGTTPNNANDNALFTVTGATEIVRFFGRMNNGTRVADMFGVHSGSNAHGPAAQFYGNELHWYNNTGDTRHQNGAYVVTVEYTK